MRTILLAHVKRVVIKIGSGVISDHSGLDLDRIATLCEDVHALRQRGYEVILVSSAAVAAGKADLGIKGSARNLPLPIKQAAAAIGQSRLMRAYKDALRKHGLTAAQVLLTRDDLANRRRYLNARNTLMTLLEYGVVPVINENDTVVIDEIRFGDNDNLSAMTTNLVEAQLLVILSDVDGLYDSDPRHNTEARLISEVERITPEIEAMAGLEETLLGTGGMTTKLKAAKRATLFGAGTAIINGLTPHNLLYLFDGHELGTYFLPARDPMAARKHWIAFTKKPKGKLILDDGAHNAVAERGKSLLPSGIRQLDGTFERGDAVRLCDLNGKEFAKGVTNYNSAELIRIIGKNTREILQILGYQYGDEVVHRDNLVISN
ncbi:MAG: glutamate 5-kinase [Deltaproteobacteria bacterium]|jgi:glutamate 5-kinase|nr:glutamate 5-kinase [Deltaproteobacteria bacterium]MBW2510414.1 glutamate 5-kinase [Deltaproteobacteria bacterium]MDH4006538.1 glutamate 5-kinase [Desulfuromonadales bacterium]